MTNKLSVEVINFIACVMHPCLWEYKRSSDEEEAVVVDILFTQVEVEETVNILVLFVICEDIGWNEVEIGRVELYILIKHLGYIAKMPQFMDGCWSMLESLEFPCKWMS